MRTALLPLYRDNERMDITSERYTPALHGSGWAGVARESAAASGWPTSCAYDFRLNVTSRVTDGYKPIHRSQYDKHITLLLPSP